MDELDSLSQEVMADLHSRACLAWEVDIAPWDELVVKAKREGYEEIIN